MCRESSWVHHESSWVCHQECHAAPECDVSYCHVLSPLLTVQEGDYGKQRLWGALGWGGFSTLAGWAIDMWGIPTGFWLQWPLILPALYYAWRLHDLPPHRPEVG